MSMLQLMRRHGVRSSFRDWSGEVSNFPRDVAEMVLAHTVDNKVEAACRRGDLFAKHQKLMQAWVDYLTTLFALLAQPPEIPFQLGQSSL